jgi:hypothetical protein
MKGNSACVNVSEERGEKEHNSGICEPVKGRGFMGDVSVRDELEVMA